MPYVGRPGPSPVLAALFAAGVVREEDRILDLGCGGGMDAIALVRWGCTDVTGIDSDAQAIALARRRAARAGLGRRVRFEEADALALQDVAAAGEYDVLWDGLLLNNLRGADIEAYARSVAHATVQGGLLLLQFRVTKRAYEGWIPEAADEPLHRWFDFGPPASTFIPEHPEPSRAPPYARVSVQVGERNGRRA
jgi:SAM-dependent methyltransferase